MFHVKHFSQKQKAQFNLKISEIVQNFVKFKQNKKSQAKLAIFLKLINKKMFHVKHLFV